MEICNQYCIDVILPVHSYSGNEYVRELAEYIREKELSSNIRLLGLVGRDEQLAIMKNADMLVQPSLFEGG